MLRDNLVELIEPMLSGAGPHPLAPRTNRKILINGERVSLDLQIAEAAFQSRWYLA